MTQGARPDRPWPLRISGGRMWLGLLLSVICLVLVLDDIDLREVAATLRTTNLAWLTAAALTALLTGVIKAWRWQLLLYQKTTPATEPPPLRLHRLTSIWLAGAALNLGLPAPRSGDLARAYLAGEAGNLSKSMVLGAIAAEKLLDIVLLAACFLGLLPFVTLPAELASRQAPVIGLACLLLLTAVVILWQRVGLLVVARRLLSPLPHRWSISLLDSAERALQGLDALRHPRRVLLLATISTGSWLLAAYTNYLIYLAMGLPPSWVQSFFVLVVLQAGVAIPSSPGKLGVFQVLCRWALSLFGLSAAAGLSYGILLYLAAPATLMLAGALALVLESWQLRQESRARGHEMIW